VNSGAICQGHPIGATGVMVLVRCWMNVVSAAPRWSISATGSGMGTATIIELTLSRISVTVADNGVAWIAIIAEANVLTPGLHRCRLSRNCRKLAADMKGHGAVIHSAKEPPSRPVATANASCSITINAHGGWAYAQSRAFTDPAPWRPAASPWPVAIWHHAGRRRLELALTTIGWS
jgi:hypothetical protein